MKFITAIFITALFSVTLLFTSCVTARLPYAEPIVKKIGGEEKIDVENVVITESQEDTKSRTPEQEVEELNKEFGSYSSRKLSVYNLGPSVVSIEELYYYGESETIRVVIINGEIFSIETMEK